jgi:glycerol-3-phosphate O-acyltransferase
MYTKIVIHVYISYLDIKELEEMTLQLQGAELAPRSWFQFFSSIKNKQGSMKTWLILVL